MPQDGWRSRFLLWEQLDWDTVSGAVAKQVIYEFISTTLKDAGDPITPERIHGNPSPIRNITGMRSCAGDIAMHMHPEHMLIFLKHLLMDAPTSTDFVAKEVYGNGAGAGKAYGASQSLDTQPSATSPPSDPGKMIVTIAGSTGSGTVTLTGTDHNGTAISEVLTFSGNGTQTSTFYFQSIDAGGVDVGGTLTGGTMLIMCDKNTYTHVFNLGDYTYVDETVDKHGLAIELVKGTIPNLYLGCMLNTGVISLGDTMQATWSLLGKQGNTRLAFDGTGTPTSISGYTKMVDTNYPHGDEIYPGWGLALQLDSIQTDIESLSFSFSNNLAYPTRYKATNTPVKPVRQGDREIAVTSAIDFEAVADGGLDLSAKFRGNVPLAVIWSAVAKPYAGPEYSISMSHPRCQLTANPDPEIGGPADILQSLSLRPIRTVGASSSNECTLTIVSTEAS